MTATPTPDPYREWDAAYVLGALGPHDRREFEQHLATCAGCRDAVGELAGVPGLLGLLTAEHAAALTRGTDDVVVPLPALAASARRDRARRRGLLAAAAVALVVAGGASGAALAGSVVGTDASPTAAPTAAPTAGPEATDPATVELVPVGDSAVHAELVLTPAAWGTRLDWSCSYATTAWAGDAAYELVLVDHEGGREVVATWSATDDGYSSGLGASSAVPLEGIARLELGVVGMDGALAAADV